MAILEKLSFASKAEFQALVNAVGETLGLIIDMAKRLVAAEKRIAELQAPQQDPKSKFQAGETEVVRLRRIADLARRFRSHVRTIGSDGVLIGDELEGLLREQLGIPREAEEEPGYTGPKLDVSKQLADVVECLEEKECDGRPCTCGSTDREYDEHLQEVEEVGDISDEELKQVFDELAGDILQKAGEGEPRKTCNCCHGAECPTHDVQDTGAPLEDWMMDAVQRAVLDVLQPFIGMKASCENIAHAARLAEQQLQDMCLRFGVTRKYRIDLSKSTPNGQLSVDIVEA